jgi:hypothetical protein
MGTFHRRQLRPRPLTAGAQQLLRLVRSTRNTPTTGAQLVAASRLPLGSGWNALIQLTDRQLVRIDEAGHVVLTRAGAARSEHRAA